MHILIFIIMFIIESIGAALNGDYSGTVIIGKVLMGIGIFCFVGCILIGFSTEGSGKIFLISIVMTIVGRLLAKKRE